MLIAPVGGGGGVLTTLGAMIDGATDGVIKDGAINGAIDGAIDDATGVRRIDGRTDVR